MAFSDRHIQPSDRPDLEHLGANSASWIAAGLMWFGAFFVSLHVLGWWAFAFPPWLIIMAALTPVMAILPTNDVTIGLAVVAISWIGTGAVLIGLGLRRGSIAMLSGGVHALLPIVTMALAYGFEVSLGGEAIRASGA